MEEIWKPIEEFDGEYMVSNHGRVKSLKRHKERIMPMTIQESGYYAAMFHMNKKSYCRKVHRLVCEAFIPNPDNLPEINHIDGNKLNNHVSNLEWCTHQQNVTHSWDHGLAHPHGPSKEGRERLSKIWRGVPYAGKGEKRKPSPLHFFDK